MEESKCEYCHESISALTKNLQKEPSSVKFAMHGYCCASCSPEKKDFLIKGKVELINSYYHPIAANAGIPVNIPANSFSSNTRKDRKKRLIRAGAMLMISAIPAIVIMIYFELWIFGLLCILLVISGLITYLVGTRYKSLKGARLPQQYQRSEKSTPNSSNLAAALRK
jgi:hypothetical protein